jgi:hypothetical protein
LTAALIWFLGSTTDKIVSTCIKRVALLLVSAMLINETQLEVFSGILSKHRRNTSCELKELELYKTPLDHLIESMILSTSKIIDLQV